MLEHLSCCIAALCIQHSWLLIEADRDIALPLTPEDRESRAMHRSLRDPRSLFLAEQGHTSSKRKIELAMFDMITLPCLPSLTRSEAPLRWNTAAGGTT
jgi:hypothetical protein